MLDIFNSESYNSFQQVNTSIKGYDRKQVDVKRAAKRDVGWCKTEGVLH